jgi:membrane protein YdbS with pleckstrin-like domain
MSGGRRGSFLALDGVRPTFKDAIMNCTKCGGNLPEDAAFCSKCGAPVAELHDYDDETAGEPHPATAANRLRAGRTNNGREAAEEELWSGTFSPLAMAGAAIGCAIISVVAIVVAAFANQAAVWWGAVIVLLLLWAGLVLALLYRRLTVRYRLTNYRFFHDTGLFSRTGNRIEAIDIDDVTVRQGLIERMFGVGTILIASSDRTDPSLDLPGIEDVRTVADLIDSTRRAERHRRGLHIESI